jgi:hypothetical protein
MSTSATIDSSWVRLGSVPPTALGDARLQVHHAVQVAVSAAISYLPAVPDDSHTALRWVAPIRALVTELIPADRPFRIALRPADLSLHALDATLNVGRSFALPGNDVGAAQEWLGEVAKAAGLDAARLSFRKHYTIPTHAVAEGAAFTLRESNGLTELERYWSNASLLLEEVARDEPTASAVRVWPHHFDIATLIALPPRTTAPSRTIGVGHSPGDEWYGEPYWYVSPYPSPPVSSLPPTEIGAWHTTHWIGAVLTASDYVADDAVQQQRRVVRFVTSAIRACRKILEDSN